ncbi:MAG: hydroxymyristoyl-ACP dehydratase [Bacteroidota bacterium]
MKHLEDIISKLPYGPNFCFVDRLESVSEEEIVGEYRFRADAPWQADHFPSNPIVPGVIITECMAQIGLVCFGLHLYHLQHHDWPGPEGGIAFTESQVKFWHVLRPGESVRVRATKQYYRLGKLKVEAEMLGTDGQRIAKGTLAGVLNRKRR